MLNTQVTHRLAEEMGTTPTHIEPESPTIRPQRQLLDGGIPVTPRHKRSADSPAFTQKLRRRAEPSRRSRRRLRKQVPTARFVVPQPAPAPIMQVPEAQVPIKYLQEVLPPRHTKKITAQALVDEAQAQLCDQALWEQIEKGSEWTVYTDGSVKDGRGGYSVILEDPTATTDNERWRAIGYGFDGPSLSSIRTEALAILHAIAAIPGHIALTINTDSLVGVHAFRLFVEHRTTWHTGRRRNHPDACIWNYVYELCKRRQKKVKLVHVKAHTGIPGNEAADKHAKLARERSEFAWDVRDIYSVENRFNLAFSGFVTTRPARSDLGAQAHAFHQERLDDSIRRHLPEHLQHATMIPGRLDLSRRTQLELEEQEGMDQAQDETQDGTSQEESERRGEEQQETGEEDELEDAVLLRAAFPDLSARCHELRRERQSHRASFHLKLLYDCLPTSLRMLDWQSHLVQDGRCRRCHSEDETRTHLRECTSVTREVKTRFTKTFQDTVLRATRRPERTRRWLAQLQSYNTSLIHIDWIYLGVIPDNQVSDLAAQTDITLSRARMSILAGLVAAREIFIDEIWRARCDETIRWERANGITTKAKRTWSSPGSASQAHNSDARGFLQEGPYSGLDDSVQPAPDNQGEIRPKHETVDKKRDRWKQAGSSLLKSVYGQWKVQLLGGQSDCEAHSQSATVSQ